MDCWFTFITHPYIEPTNNIVEKALREIVVQRKIIGTLRNEKGVLVYETMMSMIATWKMQKLNPYEMMVKCIRS